MKFTEHSRDQTAVGKMVVVFMVLLFRLEVRICEETMYIPDALELSCRRIRLILHNFFLENFGRFHFMCLCSLLELTNRIKRQIFTQYKGEFSLN